MRILWQIALILLLASAALLFQACGASMGPRHLILITISPTSADAKSSNGQIQFVATGHYDQPPYSVTPLQSDWGAVAFPQKIASVDQNGLATCETGASGTTTVEAWVVTPPGPVCNIIDSAGRPGCGDIWASAQLTCP